VSTSTHTFAVDHLCTANYCRCFSPAARRA
jgi:hypothetical protein